MKNFFDKANLGMQFFIIAIFGIAVIYCIISFIIGLFNNDKATSKKIDIDNIEKYVSIYSDETQDLFKEDESKLVRDYSQFYTLQSMTSQYVQYLIDGKYSKTYSILGTEIKEKYSKKQYLSKIEKFAKENFIVNVTADTKITEYDAENCLSKAYKINDTDYLCEYVSLNDEKIMVGIRVEDSSKTYNIFYINF